MRQRRKSPWWLLLGLERVLEQVPGQVLEQGQPWALEQVLAQVLAQVQGLEQGLGLKRRRNLSRLSQVSSRRRASTSLYRFSRRRQKRCASCQRFERRLRLQELRWQPTSPIY
jgi:hypothetical protein